MYGNARIKKAKYALVDVLNAISYTIVIIEDMETKTDICKYILPVFLVFFPSRTAVRIDPKNKARYHIKPSNPLSIYMNA